MAITAAMVKELREKSGAGMMDAKKALTETDGDMEAAISEYRLAIDLNPSLADSHHSLGAALIHSGRPEEALPHLEIAISLSPNDGKIGPFNARISMAHFCLQDYENAILWVRKAIRLPRVQWPTHAVLTSALAHIQRMDEAAT